MLRQSQKAQLACGFEDREIYQLAWSPDGKNLAYSIGECRK